MRTLLALLLFAAALSAAPEDAAVKVNRHQIFGDRTEASHAEGAWASGTVVKSGGGTSLILTNRHVAPNNGSFYFVVHTKVSYAARWLGADDRTDLALLQIDFELPAATLADAEPAAGADVHLWGCPRAGPMTARSGHTNSDADGHKDEDGYRYLQTTLRSDHGDSGAGVFGQAGQLVGVCYGGPEWSSYRGPAFNQNVRLADVKRFLGEKAGAPAARVREQPK